MSGYDLASLLEEIIYDILNPGQADLVSLFFRIVLTVMASIVVLGFLSFVLEILKNVLKGFVEPLYPVKRFVTSPFRAAKRKKEQREFDRQARQYKEHYYQQQMKLEEEAAHREAERKEELEKVLDALKMTGDEPRARAPEPEKTREEPVIDLRSAADHIPQYDLDLHEINAEEASQPPPINDDVSVVQPSEPVELNVSEDKGEYSLTIKVRVPTKGARIQVRTVAVQSEQKKLGFDKVKRLPFLGKKEEKKEKKVSVGQMTVAKAQNLTERWQDASLTLHIPTGEKCQHDRMGVIEISISAQQSGNSPAVIIRIETIFKSFD